MLYPSEKVSAAIEPEAPTGLGLYDQDGNKFTLQWSLDTNILISGDLGTDSYSYFGYETTIKTLKNKTIKKIDKNLINNGNDSTFLISNDLTKIGLVVNNKKMATQGFKFSVKPYVYDINGEKVYGKTSSEKVIIPRATVKKKKLVGSGKVKVSWGKIAKAKSYTVYLSSNNGSSYKKKGTTKSTSFVLSNLKYYQDYTVYVAVNGIKYKKKKYNSTKPKLKTSNTSTGFYISRR